MITYIKVMPTEYSTPSFMVSSSFFSLASSAVVWVRSIDTGFLRVGEVRKSVLSTT